MKGAEEWRNGMNVENKRTKTKGNRDPLTPHEHSITNCSFAGPICSTNPQLACNQEQSPPPHRKWGKSFCSVWDYLEQKRQDHFMQNNNNWLTNSSITRTMTGYKDPLPEKEDENLIQCPENSLRPARQFYSPSRRTKRSPSIVVVDVVFVGES